MREMRVNQKTHSIHTKTIHGAAKVGDNPHYVFVTTSDPFHLKQSFDVFLIKNNGLINEGSFNLKRKTYT